MSDICHERALVSDCSFIVAALASLITMAPTLLVTTREPDTGFCDHITGDTSQTQTLCVVSGAVIV